MLPPLTYRRITFKFQTYDVRPYLLTDTIRRARNAVVRSGGDLLGGVFAPRVHIKRWCVLRSPHVNKKSREHFWMKTHRRVFKWNADTTVPTDAPLVISSSLPSSIALRVQVEEPGLLALRPLFQTLQTATALPTPQQQQQQQQ